MNISILINIISCFISYLIGAIPTGYWFAKYFFNIDITKSGSGNIGATNVGRVLGKKYFILIFLIDFAKAFLMLYLTSLVCSNFIFIIFSAVALLIGNAYSVFLGFRGGKGVATTAGIVVFLFPIKLFIFSACAWVLILVITRRVFIASLSAAYFSCLIYSLTLFCHPELDSGSFYFLIFICLWLTFRHRSNFKRI